MISLINDPQTSHFKHQFLSVWHRVFKPCSGPLRLWRRQSKSVTLCYKNRKTASPSPCTANMVLKTSLCFIITVSMMFVHTTFLSMLSIVSGIFHFVTLFIEHLCVLFFFNCRPPKDSQPVLPGQWKLTGDVWQRQLCQCFQVSRQVCWVFLTFLLWIPGVHLELGGSQSHCLHLTLFFSVLSSV